MKPSSTVLSKRLDDSMARLNRAVNDLEKIMKRLHQVNEQPVLSARAIVQRGYHSSDRSSQHLSHE